MSKPRGNSTLNLDADAVLDMVHWSLKKIGAMPSFIYTERTIKSRSWPAEHQPT